MFYCDEEHSAKCEGFPLDRIAMIERASSKIAGSPVVAAQLKLSPEGGNLTSVDSRDRPVTLTLLLVQTYRQLDWPKYQLFGSGQVLLGD